MPATGMSTSSSVISGSKSSPTGLAAALAVAVAVAASALALGLLMVLRAWACWPRPPWARVGRSRGSSWRLASSCSSPRRPWSAALALAALAVGLVGGLLAPARARRSCFWGRRHAGALAAAAAAVAVAALRAGPFSAAGLALAFGCLARRTAGLTGRSGEFLSHGGTGGLAGVVGRLAPRRRARARRLRCRRSCAVRLPSRWSRGAAGGRGGPARHAPRPPGRAHRSRARTRARVARDPRAGPGRDHRSTRGAARGAGRGGRVLRRRGGDHERRQVRAGLACDRQRAPYQRAGDGTVADDGVGGADPTRGTGLRGLRDRLEALDGRLDVESSAASGTRISAEIPCG